MSSLPPLKAVRRSGHSRHGVHTVPEAHEVHVSECTHCQGMAAVAQHREAFKGPWQFVAKIASVMQEEARILEVQIRSGH